MKFLVICDYRENYMNYSTLNQNKIYNDHPDRKNIEEIISAIKLLGYECEYFGGILDLINAIDNNCTFDDCLFLNLTDGMEQSYSRVQAPALLDILKVPYSGSDVFASALMNNKYICKKALSDYSINMSKSCIVNTNNPLDITKLKNWNFPLFVKPNCEGSSLGISQDSVCYTANDVQKRCSELSEIFDEILIEEFVFGIDVTNFLIGNDNSYIVNDVITAKLFDNSPFAIYGNAEKEQKLRNLFLNDEYLPNDIVKQIQEHSCLIAKLIGVRDICRIDYRVNLSTKEIFFIEINSAPRFSSTSEIGFIAQKRNLSFAQMVKYYIDTFLKRIS